MTNNAFAKNQNGIWTILCHKALSYVVYICKDETLFHM